MTVPKIEITAKMINKAIANCREESPFPSEEKIFFSFLGNKHLRKKLALGDHPTPVKK